MQIVQSKTGKLQIGVPKPGDYQLQTGKFSKPEYYTVQFSIAQPPATVAGIRAFDARADIIWSISGNDIRRTISVINGAVISGVAEQVKVNVYDVTNAAAGVFYKVDTVVGRGCRPSTQQPPRLFEASYQIASTASQVIEIDPSLGIISVNITALLLGPVAEIAAGDLVGLFFDPAVTPLGGFSADPKGGSTWIPIPPGATALAIQNKNAAKTMLVGIMWGIEG